MTWTRHENGAGATSTFGRRRRGGGGAQLYHEISPTDRNRRWRILQPLMAWNESSSWSPSFVLT